MKEKWAGSIALLQVQPPLFANPSILDFLHNASAVQIGHLERQWPPFSVQEQAALRIHLCPQSAPSLGAETMDGAHALGADLCSPDSAVIRMGNGPAVQRWSKSVLRSSAHTPNSFPVRLRGIAMSRNISAFFIPSDWVNAVRSSSPLRRREGAVELLEQVKLLDPKPDAILYAARIIPPLGQSDSTSGRESRVQEGLALIYSRSNAQQAQRNALYHSRATGGSEVVSWWGHFWGPDPTLHVVSMQETIPVAPGLSGLATEGQVFPLLPPALATFNPNDFVTPSGKRRVVPPRKHQKQTTPLEGQDRRSSAPRSQG